MSANASHACIYASLRAEYPLLADHFTGSEERGNASYPVPFTPTKKKTWIPDLKEEIADALVYVRAEMALIGDAKRTSAEALGKFQELREIERRLVTTLRQLDAIDTPWATRVE